MLSESRALRLLCAVLPVLALMAGTLARPTGAAARGNVRPFVIRVDPVRAGPADAVVPTLAEAVALVPAARARAGEARPILIEVAAGVHRLERPVRIGQAAGGRPGAPLVIRGSKGGGTRLTGSVPLRRVESPPPPGADPEVRDRIVAYSLPPAAAAVPNVEVRRIHSKPAPPVGLELFDEDGALVPARWPNEGWAAARVRGAGKRPEIEAEGGRAARWVGEPDLWIAGYFGEDWSFETLPAFIAGSGRLATAMDPLYRMRDGARFYVSHALSELDQPGEWWRDAKAGIVHVIPRRGLGDAIEASVADRLLDIEGAVHVRIEDLTFERSRGDAVRVTGGTDVIVQRCTIRWTGGRGIVFEGATRSGLRQSAVTDTGEGGVSLDGGDRKTLTPAGLFVEDTVILRFARLGRTYKFAVEVVGVGARVVRNAMAEAPHTAIRFQGNDHEISFNEIANVATETSDAGAIYTGRDIAAQGTVVRHNFIHDIRPASGFEVKGVYLDDMASGIAVEGNLFLRVEQPVFIGGGRDNTVKGNVFALSSPAVHIDGRGTSWSGPPIDSPENEVQIALREVPTQSPAWRARYPRLAGLMRDDPAAAKRNAVRDNLVIAGTLLRIESDADPRAQTIEGNRTIDDMILGHEPLKELARRARLASVFAPVLRMLRSPAHDAMPLDRMDRAVILSEMGIGRQEIRP
jgi:hypothetical protein